MKRTFISVRTESTETFRNAVADIQQILGGEKIKWEDPGKLHVTLAFIGETSEGTIKDVSAGLAVICNRHQPFTFTVAGTGIFKSIADPRVIWAGIEDFRELAKLQAEISSMLDSLGIITENKPFKPHITLGRIKNIKQRTLLSDIVEKYNSSVFMKPLISEVIYCESILRPEGALHLPIKYIPLGKK